MRAFGENKEMKSGQKVNKKDVVDLYKKGLSMQEVSNRLGISRERVRQILKAQGVGTRDKGGK